MSRSFASRLLRPPAGPWALFLVAAATAACNAIFGITKGVGTGAETGGAGHGGGYTGPLKCDGTDPGGTDGLKARWVVTADNATGYGVGLRADGSVVFVGDYQGTSTIFGSQAIGYTDAAVAGNGLFLVSYAADGSKPDARGWSGPGDVGINNDGGFVNTALHVAVDKAGRMAIAGNFRGSVTIAGTTLSAVATPIDGGFPQDVDGFLAWLDTDGSPMWPPRRLGGPLNDEARAIAFDSQGNLILLLASVGSATDTLAIDAGCGALPVGPTPTPDVPDAANNVVSISKIVPNGACAWHTSFSIQNGYSAPNDNGGGLAIAVDPHDDVILAGGATTARTIIGNGLLGNENPYTPNAFAAKLAGADGSVLWRRPYDAENTQSVTSVAADPCGNMVLGGMFLGSAKFGSLPLLGYPADQNINDAHGFLVKLDPNGEPIWSQGFWDFGWQGVTALLIDHASDIAVVGILQDQAASKGVSFLGATLPPSTPLSTDQTDFYVAKVKGDGTLRWAKRFGGGHNDVALGLAIDDAGHLAVTGSASSDVDFGNGKTVNTQGAVMFGVVFDP